MLSRMARKAENRGRAVSGGSADGLHALRKSLKKLRYSTEYLDGLFKHKDVRPYGKAIKRLLEFLGAGNDAVVAATLARSLCTDGAAALPIAADALAAWLEAEAERARRKLPKAWRRFADVPNFW